MILAGSFVLEADDKSPIHGYPNTAKVHQTIKRETFFKDGVFVGLVMRRFPASRGTRGHPRADLQLRDCGKACFYPIRWMENAWLLLHRCLKSIYESGWIYWSFTPAIA
ncbi:hypothetical protein FE257_001480 [Aspergillus nanangensis]|uniref:Uncharacterized protein n=1 Tax=Aspergillus nanangensis TaxID=2582783 RepID=A0AAD4CDL5_ASPNN|nr:hypothetical protein FE257_001480 [Aspergillus nanangensis]